MIQTEPAQYMVPITTDRVNYHKMPNEYALNATRQSGDPNFAPTWDMIHAYKEGSLSREEYTLQYLELMRQSFRDNQRAWSDVVWQVTHYKMRLVILCYCKPPPEFCHRHLLAEMFQKVFTTLGHSSCIVEEKSNQLRLGL